MLLGLIIAFYHAGAGLGDLAFDPATSVVASERGLLLFLT